MMSAAVRHRRARSSGRSESARWANVLSARRLATAPLPIFAETIGDEHDVSGLVECFGQIGLREAREQRFLPPAEPDDEEVIGVDGARFPAVRPPGDLDLDEARTAVGIGRHPRMGESARRRTPPSSSASAMGHLCGRGFHSNAASLSRRPQQYIMVRPARIELAEGSVGASGINLHFTPATQ